MLKVLIKKLKENILMMIWLTAGFLLLTPNIWAYPHQTAGQVAQLFKQACEKENSVPQEFPYPIRFKGEDNTQVDTELKYLICVICLLICVIILLLLLLF